MKPIRLTTLVLLMHLFGLLCAYSGCSVGTPDSQSLSVPQQRLLDLGFKAASALPIVPHIKSRSRAQERIVAMSLELDQPKRALGYIEQIANWRRAAAHADYVCYHVTHNLDGDVTPLLESAIAASALMKKDANSQAWRRDRINAKIARAYLVMGKPSEASRYARAVVDVDLIRAGAESLSHGRVAGKLHEFDAVIATGDFEQVQAVLSGCADLFDRFYLDTELRMKLGRRVRSSSERLPPSIRFGLIMRLAESAAAHYNKNHALVLVGKAEDVLSGARWSVEQRTAMQAAIVVTRHRSGETEGSKAELTALLHRFLEDQEAVLDIYRAGTLRTIAEAYVQIGEKKQAVVTYRQAVEAGVINPNSRPRSQDLTATCCSMLRLGVDPGDALMTRLVQICDELGDPW